MLIFLTLVIILTVSIYTNLFILPFLFHVEDFCFCSSFCKFVNFFFLLGREIRTQNCTKCFRRETTISFYYTVTFSIIFYIMV